MKFENVYWDADTLNEDHRAASILAIGDSWFWYPFPGGSLLNALGPLVAGRQHTILAIGNNGAEAYDYVLGKYEKIVRTALAQHGTGLSAVFLSGGGNDFAGFSDLRPLLERDCSGAANADECYRPGDADGTLDWFLRKLKESYALLLGRVLLSTPPELRVFMHNYDYPIPTGRGVYGGNSGWLKPALDDAQVPPGLQQACLRHLIDRLTDVLRELAARDPVRIVLVDSTDTLVPADWANELHPKPAGFRKIARERWLPLLQAHGLAN